MAALLAMQSTVIAAAILSVCPLHAGTLSRRMKVGSYGLYCGVAKHSSFLTPIMVAGSQRLQIWHAAGVCQGPSLNLTRRKVVVALG